MDWEDQLHALNALAQCSLKMCKPGDWYVDQPVEIKSGNLLKGEYGSGESPALAVFDHWRRLVDEIPLGDYLVVNAGGSARAAYRWDRILWKSINEEAA